MHLLLYSSMNDNLIKDYCEKNKEWLRELSISGEPVIRAIALAILKRGGSDEVDQYEK